MSYVIFMVREVLKTTAVGDQCFNNRNHLKSQVQMFCQSMTTPVIPFNDELAQVVEMSFTNYYSSLQNYLHQEVDTRQYTNNK